MGEEVGGRGPHEDQGPAKSGVVVGVRGGAGLQWAVGVPVRSAAPRVGPLALLARASPRPPLLPSPESCPGVDETCLAWGPHPLGQPRANG